MESMRLPGKPLKLIGNKTLIQRVHEQALQSNAKEVLVATDSEEIKKYSLLNGINVPFKRPKKLSSDDKKNILNFYENKGKVKDFINVHETEKGGISLTATKKRCETLKKILGKHQVELNYLNTITNKETTFHFTHHFLS